MYDNGNYTFPNQMNSMQIWQQVKMQQEAFKNQLAIDQEAAKVWLREESKMRVLDRRMKLHQEEKERKLASFEEIAIDQDGNVIVTTRNLSILAQPRQVVNMHSPQIYIAERSSGKIKRVLILSCWVREEEKRIFLDAKKVENGAYLLGKFAAVGISVLAPSARAKDYMRQLIALLVRQGVVADIPNEPGWTVTENGRFLFVDEERLTWEKILMEI